MLEEGPELKTALRAHAITIINSTVSLITGGSNNSGELKDITSKTWYYNHETKTFTSGPTLIKARTGHGSATIIDKMTKEKIPVVTGGFSITDQNMDLTELLIKEQWQIGKYVLIY